MLRISFFIVVLRVAMLTVVSEHRYAECVVESQFLMTGVTFLNVFIKTALVKHFFKTEP